MLVEFTAQSGDEVWVNSRHVVAIQRVAIDLTEVVVDTKINEESRSIFIIGTPAEVAAKLNGEAK